MASPAKHVLLAGPRQCSVCRSFDIVEAFQVKGRGYVRCRRCGLIFDERIDSAEEEAKYESDVFQPAQSHHRLDFRRTVFEESLREIDRDMKPGRLLDVGCGNGMFLDLARRHGWETYGVELSPLACAHARESFGLNVIHGKLPEVKFADSFFDVVTLYDVLCHVASPIEQLTEIRRILKVGGLLVLRIRNATFHVGLIRVAPSFEPCLVFHLYCFTPRSIRYLLRTAGYTRVTVRNSWLTAFDPYSISPVWGDRGMQALKKSLHVVVEGLYRLSAGSLILGPSLKVRASKGSEDRSSAAHHWEEIGQ